MVDNGHANQRGEREREQGGAKAAGIGLFWREAEEGDGLIFLKNTVGEIPHCRTIYIEKKR